MRATILTLFAFSAVTTWAQPVFSPSNPAITASPIAPAISTSPTSPLISASPGTPALTTGTTDTTGTVGVTNPISGGTNFSLSDVSVLLSNLQASAQFALPALAALNDNFTFISLASTTNSDGSTGSFGNFSLNLGTNFATNLGVDASVPTATGTTGTDGTAAVTNNFGIPGGLIAFPLTRDTLRSLLVLQNDIERMLPLLNTLNGGTNNFIGVGLTPGFAPGNFTNVFNTSTGP